MKLLSFNNLRKSLIVIVGVLFMLIMWCVGTVLPPSANAQNQDNRWSAPFEISSDGVYVSSNQIVTDRYGYVHLFWFETGFPDSSFLIQYARFDGETWTSPIDIYQGHTGQGELSPFVDDDNILHLVWSEEWGGVAYHMSAFASSAVNLRSWGEPTRIAIPAQEIKFRVDSKGDYHILYISYLEGEEGVYAVYSKDKGRSWSLPTRIDPDKQQKYLPSSLQFEIDKHDRLHAVWFYFSTLDGDGNFVSYSHSIYGGQEWSEPNIMDKVAEGHRKSLLLANPILAVNGYGIHVIWAGAEGVNLNRYHRISRDGGLTWSIPARIFGDLNGQATDGFAVDGEGGIHFLGQLRYPQGIYHAYWDDERGQWIGPFLVYLIKWDYRDPMDDRIHAHHLRPSFRLGNQLVVTFTDPPSISPRRLFVMQRYFQDIALLTALRTPTPNPIPTDNLIETQSLVSATLQVDSDLKYIDMRPTTTSSNKPPYLIGVIPTLLFVLLSVIYIRVQKKNR